MRSIRRFLLAGVLLVVSTVLAAGALVGYLDASHELEELFDARLAQSARITQRLLNDYLQHSEVPPDGDAVYPDWHGNLPAVLPVAQDDEATPLGHEYEGKLYFQLFDGDGRLLLRSPEAPPVQLVALQPGFAGGRDQDHDWRTFTLQDGQTARWLVVAERDDVRGELASKLALRAILPPLVALPLLLLLLWGLVRRGLRPLRRLTQDIGRRHPANLSPLPGVQVEELSPLTTELNRLMRALADALEREQQFTNEAAHELKTPLAVLRIHVENALNARDDTQRDQSLHKALRALRRSDRLVQQLLTQARLDNQQDIERAPLRLDRLLRDTLAELTPLALEKHQTLSLHAEFEAPFEGQPVLLGLLFGNLLDNAIRYTPPGGTIAVSLNGDEDHYRVCIHDSGPGIAPEQLPRLWQRFYRGNPQQGDGAGLGLAIVRRAANLHRGRVRLHNHPDGGLEAEVWLPRPPN
ncbi:two-component system sensor histidine kinase [Oceanimonas sp. GK1]|uniref:ATP-binding protein n=1 Tax=Oceanimonas sp. (strain GK1 / IBRC-M 10197) TaxID=511062 RepID=UPI0002494B40|nr:ATP-binding protein [Oceanimonas sp. GK1]AEY00325.1 two-component system sensor histidine kinase [Oceanimonas sp. GK1]